MRLTFDSPSHGPWKLLKSMESQPVEQCLPLLTQHTWKLLQHPFFLWVRDSIRNPPCEDGNCLEKRLLRHDLGIFLLQPGEIYLWWWGQRENLRRLGECMAWAKAGRMMLNDERSGPEGGMELRGDMGVTLPPNLELQGQSLHIRTHLSRMIGVKCSR